MRNLYYLLLINFFFILTIALAISSCEEDPEVVAPAVNTISVNVSETTVSVKGEITSDGEGEITSKGVCYSSVNTNPTIDDDAEFNTSEGTEFNVTITGLEVGETYYFRAFAENSDGIAYGSSISFTIPQISTPTLSDTITVTQITFNSATVSSNVLSDGGASVTTRGVCWDTTDTPTISDSKTSNGTGTGSFTCSLSGLSATTTYYVRAFATNTEGTAYGEEDSFSTISLGDDEVADIDGNVYKTVNIGNQTWMAENLKVTKHPNGTSISNVTDNVLWENLRDNNYNDVYCWYDNSIANKDTYGALYSWAAAMGDNAVSSTTNPSGVQGVCPDGWHLPSDAEWRELEDFITSGGHLGTVGTALKAKSSWFDNGNGTDVYGFSGLPGGERGRYSFFDYMGYLGYWWSSNEYNSSYAYYRQLRYNEANLDGYYIYKSYGLSVRCLRD